jgi:hypothetical protein
MTQALEKAIAAAKALPAEQQDVIAAVILEEIEDERRWDEAFANSQDVLARLAAEAREDIRQGRVREVGWDEL